MITIYRQLYIYRFQEQPVLKISEGVSSVRVISNFNILVLKTNGDLIEIIDDTSNEKISLIATNIKAIINYFVSPQGTVIYAEDYSGIVYSSSYDSMYNDPYVNININGTISDVYGIGPGALFKMSGSDLFYNSTGGALNFGDISFIKFCNYKELGISKQGYLYKIIGSNAMRIDGISGISNIACSGVIYYSTIALVTQNSSLLSIYSFPTNTIGNLQWVKKFNESIVDICAGLENFIIVTKSGATYSYGTSSRIGMAGTGAISFDNSVQGIPNFSLINIQLKSVSCSAYAVVGLSTTGLIYFWGAFENSLEYIYASPTLISPGNLTFRSVSIATDHAVAVSTNGSLYVYGTNRFGQFANNIGAARELIQTYIPPNKKILSAKAFEYVTYLSMECDDGYYGLNCEEWQCAGLNFSSPNVCGGRNNSCNAPNRCNCVVPNYEDVKGMCVTYCNFVRADYPSSCSSRGTCIEFNKCSCEHPLIMTEFCEYNIVAIAMICASPFVVFLIISITYIVLRVIVKLIKQYKAQIQMHLLLEEKLIASEIELEESKKGWLIRMEDLQFHKKIAQGAFGVVFKGKYLGAPVAIKLIKEDVNPNDVDQNFEAEVKIMKSLRHCNIVQFIGVCVDMEKKLIVTEFMEGTSLENIICKGSKQYKPLSIHQKVQLLLDVSLGMNYLHNLDPPLCHRDLKPSNVLLDKHITTAKVCDFGISRVDSTNHTMTGNVGTVQYMSPEVLADLPYDRSCDVYSFGIIMNEVLFERPPYHDGYSSMFGIASKVIKGERPDIDERILDDNVTILTKYINLMKACWRQDRFDRPTFDFIVSELQNLDEVLSSQ
ncbi:serine/threonine-protein kinase/receptor [Acrasis kona]|uniref:Serine/threonine-protein kinase/receptor n=1 Tax=Acrasis kona TaxID=1008807 RepID=A0AAW2ZSB9_9EUKA